MFNNVKYCVVVLHRRETLCYRRHSRQLIFQTTMERRKEPYYLVDYMKHTVVIPIWIWSRETLYIYDDVSTAYNVNSSSDVKSLVVVLLLRVQDFYSNFSLKQRKQNIDMELLCLCLCLVTSIVVFIGQPSLSVDYSPPPTVLMGTSSLNKDHLVVIVTEV